MTIHASRRDVLKGGGALVVSFSLAGALGETLVQGATALTPDQGPTWGSLSIQIGGMQLRNAAATAKAALAVAAALRSCMPPIWIERLPQVGPWSGVSAVAPCTSVSPSAPASEKLTTSAPPPLSTSRREA